jgi:hypothetical protein
MENSVISDELQFIRFLGYIWRSEIHDKSMLEIEFPYFSNVAFALQCFLKDTGYQGYIPDGIHSVEPYKKKNGQELFDWQKEFNTWVRACLKL